MRSIRLILVIGLLSPLVLTSCTTLRPAAPETPDQKEAKRDQASHWRFISADGQDRYVVEINDAGFVDLRHLNFRNPPAIELREGAEQRLVFENRTIDRRVKVTVGLDQAKAIAAAAADLQDGGFKMCKEPPCSSVDATIEPGNRASIGAEFLKADVLTEFRVGFDDGSDVPTNSFGYLVWRPRAAAPLDAPVAQPALGDSPPNQFLILGGISGLVEPELDLSVPADITKPTILGTANPYVGGQRRFFRGAASADATFFVKNWGSAEATVTLKDGEYGRESTLNLSASKIRINLLSVNGLALRFGRFTFATPSSKVALNEVGEGFQVDLSPLVRFNGALNVSVITKRQRHPDASTAPVRDDTATLVAFTGIPVGIRGLSFFRTANFYALYGRDENKADEHSYATVGTEIALARPRTTSRGNVAGSTSFYVSRRGYAASDSVKGGVFFTELSYSPKKEGAPQTDPNDTWKAMVGIGAADDANTTSDESYVSENQGFAPDIIFFSLLARPLRVGGTPGIGSGLGNKTYLGLQYSTDRWSLLRQVAVLLVPNEIRAWNTTVSLHKYNLREVRGGHSGRDAGWEADVKFFVETLPKVKVNLGFGYYKPGDAVADFIRDDMWAITSGVVIEK